MGTEINKLNTKPLSQQAKEAVLAYIKEMDLTRGTKLPREEAMAEMLGVSRITIRKAFSNLEAEGIIFRRQGKGTFVNVDSMNIKITFNPAMEFTQIIEESGYEPTVKLLSLVPMEGRADIRGLLRARPEEEIIRSDKAFFADGKLCAFCRDFYKLSLVGGEEALKNLSDYEKSVFPYLYDIRGKKLSWDKVEIGTALSTEIDDFAGYLKKWKVGLRPYLYLKELNYGEDDRPLIYVEEYIDTSIIKYNMIRQKNIRYKRRSQTAEQEHTDAEV